MSAITAQLENGTYEHIVTNFQRQLELNTLEALDELQVNTVSQYAFKSNSEEPKPTCHHCKNPRHYKSQCR